MPPEPTAVHASGYDLKAMEEEWRTTPTDLGGWANRAMRLLRIAAILEKEVEMHRAR